MTESNETIGMSTLQLIEEVEAMDRKVRLHWIREALWPTGGILAYCFTGSWWWLLLAVFTVFGWLFQVYHHLPRVRQARSKMAVMIAMKPLVKLLGI